MVTFIEPPRPGHPKRHPVDVLRTKLWFSAVKAISGLPSAYAIELKLEPELVHRKVGGVVRPRKWDGYESGARVPQRTEGKEFAVDLAEAHFPGSADYFNSPIWRVLKREQLDVYAIDAELRKLEPTVHSVLFQEVERYGQTRLEPKEFDADAVLALVEAGSFAALAAAVLLVEKSQVIASPRLRELSLNCYFEMQFALLELPILKPVATDLFQLIDTTCKHWVFLNTQRRMDIVIFSREWRESQGRSGDT